MKWIDTIDGKGLPTGNKEHIICEILLEAEEIERARIFQIISYIEEEHSWVNEWRRVMEGKTWELIQLS